MLWGPWRYDYPDPGDYIQISAENFVTSEPRDFEGVVDRVETAHNFVSLAEPNDWNKSNYGCLRWRKRIDPPKGMEILRKLLKTKELVTGGL